MSLTCAKSLSIFFAPGLSKLTRYKADVYMKPDVNFCFLKFRLVAFTMRSKIEADFHRLIQLGVLEPVHVSECGFTHVFPVLKFIGAVHIKDFKVTVNSYANMQRYPLPNPEKLRAALSGGKLFS